MSLEVDTVDEVENSLIDFVIIFEFIWQMFCDGLA